MRLGLIVVLLLSVSLTAHSEDNASLVRKAIEHSTLDQSGIPPFHLKAILSPSFERDRDSNRNGTVEIWWASPTQWKRNLTGPGFHFVRSPTEPVTGNIPKATTSLNGSANSPLRSSDP